MDAEKRRARLESLAAETDRARRLALLYADRIDWRYVGERAAGHAEERAEVERLRREIEP